MGGWVCGLVGLVGGFLLFCFVCVFVSCFCFLFFCGFFVCLCVLFRFVLFFFFFFFFFLGGGGS